jgi:hypothetical protein
MANWALVIGCDRYPPQTPSLKGAVRDALLMREWLLAPDGGNVPTRNLSFLASPSPDGAPISEGTLVRPAERDRVVSSITELMRRSDGDTGRLFFYFAGHGLTARVMHSDEQAIACADFTPDLTTKAISLRAIREQFLASSLTPQFFFIDACRNLPFAREALSEVAISGMDRPAVPDYSRPLPDQRQCSAAQPGRKAYQTGGSGEELGAFTGSLLRGLAGEGAAKRFDPATEEYIVRFDELFSAAEKAVEEVVKHAVKDRRLIDPDLVQLPQRLVVGNSENPVLTKFTADKFARVALQVTVEPPEARGSTALEVAGPYGSDHYGPPLSAPLRLSLEPRAYSLRPRSSVFVHRPPGVPVELYEPRPITITLEPLEPGLGVGAPEFAVGSQEPFREPGGQARPGRLVVEVGNPFTTVEAIDEAGQAVSALGRLELSRAGIYRVYARTPEGTGPEKLVEVLPGGDDQIDIEPPKPQLPLGPGEAAVDPPAGEAIERDFGEQKPTGGGARWLARMALTAGVALWRAGWGDLRDRAGVEDWTRHLDTIIGLSSPTGDATALLVVLADARSQRGEGSAYVARLADKPVEILPSTATDRLRVASLSGDAGPGLLRIQIPGEPDIRFDVAIHLGLRHPTVVVVEFDVNGELGVYEHILAEASPDPEALLLEGTAQRFARQGQLQYALAFLRDRELSLAAEALHGYLLLATSPDPNSAAEVAATLIARDERFIDAKVLAALASARRGIPREEVETAARRALRSGLPVLDFYLAAAVELRQNDADEPALAQVAARRIARQVITTLAVPQAVLATPATSKEH